VTAPKPTLSDVRRDENRCESRKKEWQRSWRCQLVKGHNGEHFSLSGHRHWPSSMEVKDEEQ
jgi:hypothetical protein